MKNPLISIIIPCYNAELYINDTINSVLNQSIKNIEIIVVNDGATDNSIQIIKSISDARIKIIHQKNSGVSIARNKGMQESKGEYIIFFDADDIMSPEFIEKRLYTFQQHNNIDFVCGFISFFEKEGAIIKKNIKGTFHSIEEDVLLYNSDIATCPSNYMFKKKSLQKHSIIFNPVLSSSADRFFLLEIAKNKLKGKIVLSGGELHYRVHENSMSHQLSNKLILDTEKYYSELIQHKIIPEKLKYKALFKGYYILGGSYFKLKNSKFLKYGILSFYYSPKLFIKTFILKFLKKASFNHHLLF